MLAVAEVKQNYGYSRHHGCRDPRTYLSNCGNSDEVGKMKQRPKLPQGMGRLKSHQRPNSERERHGYCPGDQSRLEPRNMDEFPTRLGGPFGRDMHAHARFVRRLF
jgi:hypothetical protein